MGRKIAILKWRSFLAQFRWPTLYVPAQGAIPVWDGPSAGENEQISPDLKRRIQDWETGQVPIEVIEGKPDDEDRGKGRRRKTEAGGKRDVEEGGGWENSPSFLGL